MQNQKGFTLIELIIVIAIIAILAAVILINIGVYINKSKDAAATGDLDGLFDSSTKYYASNLNYNNFFATSGVSLNQDYVNVVNALAAPSMGYAAPVTSCSEPTHNCVSGVSETRWCASITLKQYSPTQYFCVDSTGTKKQGIGETCASAACP